MTEMEVSKWFGKRLFIIAVMTVTFWGMMVTLLVGLGIFLFHRNWEAVVVICCALIPVLILLYVINSAWNRVRIYRALMLSSGTAATIQKHAMGLSLRQTKHQLETLRRKGEVLWGNDVYTLKG